MKQNYANYSKQESAPADVTPVMEPVPAKELETIDTIAVEKGLLEVEKEEAPKPEPKKGTVTCSLLNVRKFPTLNGEVITKLKQDAEVTIDTESETADWYKVITASGQEGYCMKKFIEVK